MSAVERLLIWSFGVHLAVRVGAPPLRGGWPVNPQGRSACNVRANAGPAIGWAWVSAFSCQLVLASSAVVGARCAAGRSLPAMKLAFALMAAIIGSTGSWVTLSHGL